MSWSCKTTSSVGNASRKDPNQFHPLTNFQISKSIPKKIGPRMQCRHLHCRRIHSQPPIELRTICHRYCRPENGTNLKRFQFANNRRSELFSRSQELAVVVAAPLFISLFAPRLIWNATNFQRVIISGPQSMDHFPTPPNQSSSRALPETGAGIIKFYYF